MGKRPDYNPNTQPQPLVDEFNDFVILITTGKAAWTPAERKAYEKLVRRIEALS